jgi:hypothetical protein
VAQKPGAQVTEKVHQDPFAAFLRAAGGTGKSHPFLGSSHKTSSICMKMNVIVNMDQQITQVTEMLKNPTKNC